MVIVDNCANAFAFQINNGIPIIHFTNQKNDRELLNLIVYLRTLKVKDIK